MTIADAILVFCAATLVILVTSAWDVVWMALGGLARALFHVRRPVLRRVRHVWILVLPLLYASVAAIMLASMLGRFHPSLVVLFCASAPAVFIYDPLMSWGLSETVCSTLVLALATIQYAVVGAAIDRMIASEPQPGHCAHCGYDLRGTLEPRCPECGMPANRGRGV